MYQVEANRSERLLTINFAGHVDAAEAKACLDKVQTRLPDLLNGFRLLTDLTQLESMDTACAPHIRKAMDLCNAKSVSLVVRVIPDPHRDIGFNIMSLFHYGHGVRILTVETRQEADQALAQEE